MGSRNNQTTTYWLQDQIQVVCGYYKGTLEEFEKRVKKEHGNNDHGKAYGKYIDIVRTIIEKEKV
jgi:hypothetical protein